MRRRSPRSPRQGCDDGHLAVALVDAARIRELNREHRGRDGPTDVLSFPIDEDGPVVGPRELGDVVICPEYTEDLREAVVHGVLHLCGYDHETDDGEMLALQDEIMDGPVRTRSGFVALAGRPNAGKSTLVNRIVGGKVAIVSDKPQTTRREIRGIATGDDWQLVLVDLPGVQRPRDPLTERMQRRVERALADADAVLFMLNGEQRIGAGDRFIANAIVNVGVPAVTGAQQDRPARPAPNRERARHGRGARRRTARSSRSAPARATAWSRSSRSSCRMLPEGPFLYPPEDKSDLAEQVRLAELVREQVLLRTREEVPHAVEVEIDEMDEREDGLLVIQARVWAETESQKGILVGAGGRMVKAVGTAARPEIESMLGRRIHLELQVRVRKGWRRDEALLDRLGIE